MSKEKFTKGDWIVHTLDSSACSSMIIDYDEIGVGMSSFNENHSMFQTNHLIKIEGYDEDDDSCEAMANAHLIAAAPEMYRILDELLPEHFGLSANMTDEIMELLAKARGE